MLELPGDYLPKLRIEQYLECRQETQAETLLDRLIAQQVYPAIEKELRIKSVAHEEADIILCLAAVQISQYLRDARAQGKRGIIRHFRGFIRWMTNRAFGDFLDEKYADRRRLKQRIQYLLKHEAPLALWTNPEGRSVCGLAEWKAAGRALETSRRLSRLCAEPRAVGPELVPRGSPEQASLATLVYGVFCWLGHPIELEDLVNSVAVLQGVMEVQKAAPIPASEDEEEDPLAKQEDKRTSVVEETENKEILRRLWAEICGLPLRQRKILLLSGGIFGLDLLILLNTRGILGMEGVAAALEMPCGEFLALWRELPLEDKRLASDLEIQPGNVRFQRHAAIERLKTRMASLA